MRGRIALTSRSASLSGGVAPLVLLLGALSCEGEKRPYTPPTRDALAATPSAGGAAGASMVVIGTDAAAPCEEGELQLCGPATSEGVCEFGSRKCENGEWLDCVGAVYPAERDCTSAADNDCDGQPDNLVDDICRCAPGSTEPCETHPGQDGVGACRAGERGCLVAADRRSSEWGE